MIEVLWGLFGLWSYFPNYGFDIGFIPAATLIFSVLAILTVNRFKNVFSLPGWPLFGAFAATVVIASLFSPSSTAAANHLKALSFAAQMATIPFVAIWFRESRDRQYFVRVIILGSALLCFYSYMHRDQVSATFLGPFGRGINSIGSTLCLSSGILLVVAGDNQRLRWERMAASVLFIVIFFVDGFVLSSRTAIIAQIVTIIVYVVIVVPFKTGLTIGGRTNRKVAIVISVALLLSVLVGNEIYQSAALPDPVMQRLAPLFGSEQNQGAVSSLAKREMLRKKALKIVEENPFFGIGTGNFNAYPYNPWVEVPRASGGYKIISAGSHNPHSTYFKILAENGLFGFLIYSLILAWLVCMTWRLGSEPAMRGRIDLSATGWIPAYLIMSLTHDVGGFFTLMLMIVAYAEILEKIWVPKWNWRFVPRIQLKSPPQSQVVKALSKQLISRKE
ncbi:MAG: O-antigen ligase family protein [Anaerolineales bacterium]|nr:O-antigen ligase family protein [Anaerolineales bacterium]